MDEIDTIDDVSESVIPLALLLLVPLRLHSYLVPLRPLEWRPRWTDSSAWRMEPLIWESRAAGRPDKKRRAFDEVVGRASAVPELPIRPYTAVGRSGRLELTARNNRRFASARVNVGMFPQEFPLDQQLLQLLVDVLLLWQ